jgi:hypothetical protein
MTSSTGAAFIFVPIVLCILIYTYRQLTSPLLRVPGPFLARFTRLWYLSKIWRGDIERTLIDLHAKHGKVVRIAPNEYSIDDPDAVGIIYGRASLFRKSDMYQAYVVTRVPHRICAKLFANIDTKYPEALPCSQCDLYEATWSSENGSTRRTL